jgi:hypothetical protein
VQHRARAARGGQPWLSEVSPRADFTLLRRRTADRHAIVGGPSLRDAQHIESRWQANKRTMPWSLLSRRRMKGNGEKDKFRQEGCMRRSVGALAGRLLNLLP